MKKFIWIGLILLMAFVGCNLVDRDFSLAEDDFIDPNMGSLVLILDGGAIPTTKTITPDLIMDVDSYELIFVHTTLTGFDFTTTIGSSGLYVQSGFEPGNWTVEVNARNATPLVIGAINGAQGNTESFLITAGDSTPVTANVLPIAGFGDLTLTLTWPDLTVSNASITSSLDLVNISSPGGFVINLVGDPDRADYNDTGLATGYYDLKLQLYDLSDLVWGLREAVRIVAGQLTSDQWVLILDAGGLLDLETNTNMENPVEITFNPATILDFQASAGLIVSVTTNPTDPVDDSYSYLWYLNGDLLTNATDEVSGALTASISFPADSPHLTVGNHNLSVMVTVGNTLSSNTIPFTVLP